MADSVLYAFITASRWVLGVVHTCMESPGLLSRFSQAVEAAGASGTKLLACVGDSGGPPLGRLVMLGRRARGRSPGSAGLFRGAGRSSSIFCWAAVRTLWYSFEPCRVACHSKKGGQPCSKHVVYSFAANVAVVGVVYIS